MEMLSVWHTQDSGRSEDLDALVQHAEAAIVEGQQLGREQLRLAVIRAANDADDLAWRLISPLICYVDSSKKLGHLRL